MAAVLLFLLCAVVEVYSQTFPYIRYGDTGPILQNHSYMDLTTLGTSSNSNIQCHSDLNTCCTSTQGNHRGNWFFPNETRVQFFSENWGMYQRRGPQQVYMERRNNAIANGIYQCTIATNAVNSNGAGESVYLGLYANGGKYSRHYYDFSSCP